MQHASNCHGYSPGSVSHYHAPLTGCVVSVSVSVWGGCGGFTGSRPVFLDCVADGGQGQGGQGGGAGDHREDQAHQVQGGNRESGQHGARTVSPVSSRGANAVDSPVISPCGSRVRPAASAPRTAFARSGGGWVQ